MGSEMCIRDSGNVLPIEEDASIGTVLYGHASALKNLSTQIYTEIVSEIVVAPSY